MLEFATVSQPFCCHFNRTTVPCPPIVAKLVEKFELHREAYHSAGYKEAQLRQEFIDPLFEALCSGPQKLDHLIR